MEEDGWEYWQAGYTGDNTVLLSLSCATQDSYSLYNNGFKNARLLKNEIVLQVFSHNTYFHEPLKFYLLVRQRYTNRQKQLLSEIHLPNSANTWNWTEPKPRAGVLIPISLVGNRTQLHKPPTTWFHLQCVLAGIWLHEQSQDPANNTIFLVPLFMKP